ncbi:MAG: hypothetical protein O7C98_16135 [Planctomycetota bacterium]|nr:hypothetical protein [Planctomycetota bacterium]
MRWILCALAVVLATEAAWAHGSTSPPPPPERDPPEPIRPPPTPPERRRTGPTTPPELPPEPPPPQGPVTPRDGPFTRPETPGSGGEGNGPTTPRHRRARPREPVRSGRRSSGENRSWRIWWEYNREHLVGLRRKLRRSATLTGRAEEHRIDPLEGRRDEVRKVLRTIAAKERDPALRASALLALGRTGDMQDARIFLRLLRDGRQPHEVLEAAALALGMLPDIDDEETEAAVREHLIHFLRNPHLLPRRAHGFAVIATGMRARQDKRLLVALIQSYSSKIQQSEQAAVLTFAGGLAHDPMIVPELVLIARKGAIGRLRLNDIDRAHATQALGLTGSPFLTDRLAYLLKSRKSGLHTRRSAALALGRMLRECDLSETATRTASAALLKQLRTSPDSVLRGFCAVGLGGGRTPAGINDLMHAVDRGGDHVAKQFSAIGLGLARPRVDDKTARRIADFLQGELQKTHDTELASALCIGIGLGGIVEAREALLEIVGDTRKPAALRGGAAQAIGLLGRRSPEVERVLLEVMHDSRDDLLEDTALALGLMGRRGTALALVEMLPKARSARVQGRILLALGHLGNSAVVTPLLGILTDKGERTVTREFAAVALGLLGDPRDEDPLFALDADFNYLATTHTTHELIRLY